MPIDTPMTAELKAIGDWRKPQQAEAHLTPSPLADASESSKRVRALPAGRLPGADRARQFASTARARVDGALVRCEERFPGTGHHSVLYVVIETNDVQVRGQLASLHQELFGAEAEDPLAPVRLQIVDRATDLALRELVEASLVASTSRLSRVLWPANGGESALQPLSLAESQKAVSFRHQAARWMKVARVLIDAGMPGEARSFVMQAMLALARALAVEQRLPEPEGLCESLLPPFSGCWASDLPLFRRFVADEGEPCRIVLEALETLARSVQ